jgi:GTP-binding protein Era
LKIYNCKINLKLFVKVEKEWRNNETFLKSVGYSDK